MIPGKNHDFAYCIANGIYDCDIINCDETPVWLDSISNTTVEKKGAREVGIKTKIPTLSEFCKFYIILYGIGHTILSLINFEVQAFAFSCK